ncbi:oxidoreductase [Lasiosphaeria ovina]|uniref:Oxidoreductase n=1 Tax=Lasiosphaeria ovina TaxID=92902 RepID=A0AAE0N023_9PEZI|nr:oxidoreductase [Lasiosphaeria ovina]
MEVEPTATEVGSVLIIGGTRGLGLALTRRYASGGAKKIVATGRTLPAENAHPDKVKWLTLDLNKKRDIGVELVQQLEGLGQKTFDVVIISAGIFQLEDFSAKVSKAPNEISNAPNEDREALMYKVCAISPVMIVHGLFHAGMLPAGAKVVLVSSESGSVALRLHASGNFGHHASKAALNMVGRLLALELKDKGVIVSIVHPGFMRTQMTRSVGFEKFWNIGHAVEPDVAAGSLIDWVDQLDMSVTGQLWAPRGGIDIGTGEELLGPDLPTPLLLPW